MNRGQAFKVYGILDDEGYRPHFKKFGETYEVDIDVKVPVDIDALTTVDALAYHACNATASVRGLMHPSALTICFRVDEEESA